MTETKNNLMRRPPVVAVMGHIDHGKSTLLDYIRKTNIVGSEAGGITQHLSAYEVDHTTKEGVKSKITFLDTPGHEAFSAIRARGVRVADVAILVVSAEEGVKKQTIEALKCILKEELPYVVAINKIDKPTANVERTKQSLAENEIYVEGWGGTIPAVPLSAKTGEGVNDLLDMVLLVAELEELSADQKNSASGIIIESNMDPKKGAVATLIIKEGNLSKGQFVATAGAYSPVRIMENFLGEAITEATFSSPVRIIGWSKLPRVGNTFVCFDSKKDAENFVAENVDIPDTFIKEICKEDSEKKVFPIIVRADTSGSADAVVQEISNIVLDDRIRTQIIHTDIGMVSENDIKTASSNPDTIILAFNSKVDPKAVSLLDRSGVEVKTFTVIYELTDWLTKTLKERTPLSLIDEVTGEAKILKTFSSKKDLHVVGGKITSGILKTGDMVKIMRKEEEVGKGNIQEIQQQKAKTREITDGEFGMMIESKIEILSGDIIMGFSTIEK